MVGNGGWGYVSVFDCWCLLIGGVCEIIENKRKMCFGLVRKCLCVGFGG